MSRRRTWDDLYAIAMEHVAEHGSLDGVKHMYRTDDGAWLGSWLAKQREALRSGTLTAEQRAALAELGVKPDRYRKTTDYWLREVNAYLTEYGHLDVPQAYVSPSGARLGARVNGWRRLHHRGLMPADLYDTLTDLGMRLAPRRRNHPAPPTGGSQ